MFQDSIKWFPVADVLKWSPQTVAEATAHLGHEPSGVELLALTGKPDDTAHAEGNALVTAGLQRITNLITATGATQAFTAARGMAGAGTSNTATTVGMTALQGTAYYAALTTGPTPTNGAISATADFAGSFGNHAWEEWCWAIAAAAPAPGTNFTTATSSGVMLNRAVASLGTKVVGAVWTLSATVTLS
jgi:hypothetical protein